MLWVQRRQVDGVLGEGMELVVAGTKPRGRPKQTLMKNIEEDKYEWNLVEEDAYDRARWRALIKIQIL